MYTESKVMFGVGAAMVSFFGMILICMSYVGFMASREFDTRYLSEWTMADRSSTIQAKSEHIDNFVGIIEKDRHNFADNAALIYTTPQNSFDANFIALKTLRDRLETIKAMPETEFAYQTAIQQITAQEQGEAHSMIDVIKACWWRENHYIFWLAGPAIFLFICVGFAFGVGLCLQATVD